MLHSFLYIRCCTLPRTRSSMTCDNTLTTVLLPIRARAMEAAERMKSPAKIAWNRVQKTWQPHPHDTWSDKIEKKKKTRRWFYFSYLFFTPHFIDSFLSSTFIWSVYNIVMHQAGGVDHLWDHSYGPLSRQQISAEDRLQEVRWHKTPDYDSYNNSRFLYHVVSSNSLQPVCHRPHVHKAITVT